MFQSWLDFIFRIIRKETRHRFDQSRAYIVQLEHARGYVEYQAHACTRDTFPVWIGTHCTPHWHPNCPGAPSHDGTVCSKSDQVFRVVVFYGVWICFKSKWLLLQIHQHRLVQRGLHVMQYWCMIMFCQLVGLVNMTRKPTNCELLILYSKQRILNSIWSYFINEQATYLDPWKYQQQLESRYSSPRSSPTVTSPSKSVVSKYSVCFYTSKITKNIFLHFKTIFFVADNFKSKNIDSEWQHQQNLPTVSECRWILY